MNKITLQKKDLTLIITDFDDTIFSRKEQLESDENLVKYRGEEGNNYIMNILGIENFINKYYIGKPFPKTITSKLKQDDLILTAGVKELQEAKLKATGLDNFNYIVVENSIEKPDALIDYVLNKLKFIPSKIVIYEDRPDYFLERKDEIEKTLDTKVEIMFVEMNGNDREPKISIIPLIPFIKGR